MVMVDYGEREAERERVREWEKEKKGPAKILDSGAAVAPAHEKPPPLQEITT